MQQQWNAARVGLMVVLGVGAIFAAYRYVDERSSSGEGYAVYALFEDVQGLIPKSRVLVAGIPVGYIDSIALDNGLARVEIHVDEQIKLYTDATVSMRTLSLLGERVLAVEPGTVGAGELADGSEIAVVKGGVQTDDVFGSINEIAKSLEKVSKQFERAFGSDVAGQRMESALKDLSEALNGINRTIQTNEEAVNTTIATLSETTQAVGPRLVHIMENIESATTTLSDIVTARRDDIDRGVAEVDDTLISIRQAADELATVLSDMTEVTGRAARGEGTLGRLTHDEHLIDEVEGVAEGLGDVLGGVGRLRTIVELRSEYYAIARGFKTYLGLRLQPRENRYFFLQIIDDPRGKVSVVQEQVKQSPAPLDEPGEFQRTTIRRTDSLKFSAMLARRISVATFRFGILESTGGLGVDLELFRERFELNTDFFEIDGTSYPRIRVRASVQLLRTFWLLGGVDDVINGGSRDYFFGAALRFDDQDLKGLLPFAGVASVAN